MARLIHLSKVVSSVASSSLAFRSLAHLTHTPQLMVTPSPAEVELPFILNFVRPFTSIRKKAIKGAFQCLECCGEKCNSPGAVTDHFERSFSSDSNEVDRHFQCVECERKFMYPWQLVPHFQLKHDDVFKKNHKCPWCSNYFRTKEALIEHKANGCVMRGHSSPEALIASKREERIQKQHDEERKQKEKEQTEKKFNQYNEEWENKYRQEMEALNELEYTDSGEWLKFESGQATVGITDETQRNLGRIVYVLLPDEGTEIKKGEILGAVEGENGDFYINSPLWGRIVQVNKELFVTPGFVNNNPYHEGWMIKVEVKDGVEAEEEKEAEEEEQQEEGLEEEQQEEQEEDSDS